MSDDQRIVPLLVVRAAAEAIDFYVRAFGATELARYENRIDTTISHADLAIEGARFSVTEEMRAWGADAPPSLGGSPVVIQLLVSDAAEALERASAAGASVIFPLQDFCGERMTRVRDPFGHLWILRQRVEELTPEENQRRRDALFASLASARRTKGESRAEAGVSTPSPGARPSPRALAFENAVELARRIRGREIGSLELTDHFIARIERLDRGVKAVVVRDFDRAREAARRADEAIARGDRIGPLHGVPMTIKESFDVKGLATTWSAPAFAGNLAAEDAAVVARFRAAGAHFLGKTNVPLMLGDFQCESELFGPTKNPWDPSRTPGGSSGGSAAALAAGLTALEGGSDIGGSIRNPAHYCGVYGHKPTRGIISMRGHALPSVPGGPDMAVVGPLARSAEDLAVALDVLAGADGPDAAGWRLDLPPPRRRSLRGLRVAVWANDAVAPVDEEIADRVQRAADVIARAGGVVSDRARPAFESATYRATYAQLVGSVLGASASDAEYEAHADRARRLAPDDRSKEATVARAMVLDHRAWIRLDAERSRLREAWRRFFDEWDVLLCPVMATTAFPRDGRPAHARTIVVDGEEQPYFDQVFWSSLATLAYLPATVFPFGLSRSGLPIGLQAVGAEHADRTTIELARLMAEREGGFAPPPGYSDPA